MPAYRYLTYELLDEGTIARIMLNRPAAGTPRIVACWSSSATPCWRPRQTIACAW